jgi:hypothetical protein
MGFLSNIFGRRSRFGFFNRRQERNALMRRRGGIGLGAVLSLAAPFVIRRLMARRAARTA